MEGDPFTLIEGMTIAAYAVGATEGFVYIRSEYPDAIEILDAALVIARQQGWLGADVLGSTHTFDIQIRVGAGAYICGEETAMLDSLEGKRGMVRAKPPLPAISGLFGLPDRGQQRAHAGQRPGGARPVGRTATTPSVWVARAAPRSSSSPATSRAAESSRRRSGSPSASSSRTSAAAPAPADRYARCRLVGRSAPTCRPDRFDLPMDYEAFAAVGAMVGHGGIVVFDDTVDMAEQARFAMEFCAEESCGKCTPCRVGAVRGVEVIDRIVAGSDRAADVVLLEDLCELMTDGSLCAMGGLTPMPVRSALHQFPEDFGLDPETAQEARHESAPRARSRHPAASGNRRRRGDGRWSLRVVPEGTSVMRAAALAGIDVPKLCATDSLEAFGSCRLCLVEVDGRPGTPASCTTPVTPGMSVTTQTPRLEKLRRGVMELYISDHPLDCLTCPANGDCELQDMAGVVGLREVRYGYEGDNHLDLAKDDSNPYFSFDPAKCIACSRCVRACDEVQGTFALTIEGRGFDSKVSAGAGESFLESECVSCGACVQACPTSTLQEKTVIELGVPTRTVLTTCAYCGVGCSFKAELRGDQVVRMVPAKDGGANEGHSCVKGRFAFGYATHRDRVLSPMVRDAITDPWREVSWDEAISHTALRLKQIQAEHGVHAIGGITSSRCTNEEVYVVQKLIRAAFGNNNVDTCARVCHSPTGLRPQADLRHLGRHPGLPVGGGRRRHRRHRGEPD